MELRRVAETVVRRSLLAVPGISQVVPIGGDVREYQVELDPAAVVAGRDHGRGGRAGARGGERRSRRGLPRRRGPGVPRPRPRPCPLDARTSRAPCSRVRDGIPLRLGQIATVQAGAEPARGTASYRGKPAVILSVQKQPGANTLALTREIDRVLDELQRTLPPGVVIEKENFRQADFIEVAIHNVSVALRDGAILVVVILFLFLGNLRTTFISAIAIPLSLVAGVLVISAFGGTLNTMTLGGFTIAIGALVDDAIIDVENVFRRLREEHRKPEAERRSAFEVVFRASSEVRGADPVRDAHHRARLPAAVHPGGHRGSTAAAARARLRRVARRLAARGAHRHARAVPAAPAARLRCSAADEPWLLRFVKRAYDRTLTFCLDRRGARPRRRARRRFVARPRAPAVPRRSRSCRRSTRAA